MNNRDYWRKREDEALKHYITDEKEYDRELKRIYSNMLDACQKEINAFYGKYAAAEGISLAEAKKRVSKLDIAAYERKAARYVKDKDFSKRANEEMRLYNAAMKINRLEMLKANIGLELIAGHDELEKFMKGVLQNRTEEELKRQAGILGKTIKNNAQQANAIVNGSFKVAKVGGKSTFSDYIWQYQDMMREDLAKLLQSGLIQGKNPRVLAKELQKYYFGDPKKGGGAIYHTERLMRTELARVQTEAQKQSFIRNGFDEYEFIANSSCCDHCQDLNGKHFKVEKMKPGENAPPLHPHCRCSTAAYSDDAEYEAWLDYLSNGGTTEEWNKLPAAEKEKLKAKVLTNSAKSDKIQPNLNDENMKALDEGLKRTGVDYREVQKHDAPLSEDEIINALAGGDLTRGSCASLGLAYIGQKGGMNVLDFRDGESRHFFAQDFWLNKIAKLPGSVSFYEYAKSSVTAGNKLLKSVERGKKYYFVSGRHAAIVQKTDNDELQYLELQSARRSGWQKFDGNPRYTLKTRFGEVKNSFGVDSYMIEVDSLKDSDDLRYLLGYINTAEGEQRKGKYGTIK